MTERVTQEEINKILWDACDTFRGVVDAGAYKNYILTMLFIKYLSDSYQEKYVRATKLTHGKSLDFLTS